MGLLKFLKPKEEKTHFERNQAGEVVKVTRDGRVVDPDELRFKSSRQLEQEYYAKHPEKKHPTLHKLGNVAKAVDKKIVSYNRNYNPMYQQPYRPSKRSPAYNNFNPWGSMFDSGMDYKKPSSKKSSQKYAVVGGKAYPIAGAGKKGKQKKKSGGSGGFDMMDNWGLMK